MSDTGEKQPTLEDINLPGKLVYEQPSTAATTTAAVTSIAAILNKNTFLGMLAKKLPERSEKGHPRSYFRKSPMTIQLRLKMMGEM